MGTWCALRNFGEAAHSQRPRDKIPETRADSSLFSSIINPGRPTTQRFAIKQHCTIMKDCISIVTINTCPQLLFQPHHAIWIKEASTSPMTSKTFFKGILNQTQISVLHNIIEETFALNTQYSEEWSYSNPISNFNIILQSPEGFKKPRKTMLPTYHLGRTQS